MRRIRRVAQAIMLLAMLSFYSSTTEVRAASIESEEFCAVDYCADNYAYLLWDCMSGGGWECYWHCWNNYPDWCEYEFHCCYAN
jgi:hypothetical protein